VGQRLPPLGRLRRDLPLALCEALDTAVWPHPEDRGTIAELRGALAAALQSVDDEPGTIAGGPLEPLAPVAGWAGSDSRTGLAERAAAALLAAALAAAALRWAAPAPPLAPLSGALVAAIAVLALPRLAWLGLAACTIVWVGEGAEGGRAWLLAAAALPVPLLLRRAATPAWSLPAAAPLLGLATVAGAFPALTGRVARPLHRAALGALGAWWLLLAEALLHRRLLLGAPASAAAGGWDAVTAVATAPAIALAGVWAAAAVVLPLLVRGRLLVVDAVAATAWAAGLAAATQGALGTAPRGLVLGAIASALLAIAVRTSPVVRESR
jgi:hypothetical protein